MTDAPDGLGGSLDRATLVLEAAARSGNIGFADIVNLLGAVPSTVSRLLKSLTEAGLLLREDDGRYAVGIRLRGLAGLIAGRPDLEAEARTVAAALAATTHESVAIFVPVDDGVRLIAKHELPERFHYMPIGGINRSCDAHGMCLLRAAWWDRATATKYHNANGRHERQAWQSELTEARREHAICRMNDDQPGISRIAHAVVDHDDNLLAIVGISGVAAAWTPKHCTALRAQVAQAAIDLATRLGIS